MKAAVSEESLKDWLFHNVSRDALENMKSVMSDPRTRCDNIAERLGPHVYGRLWTSLEDIKSHHESTLEGGAAVLDYAITNCFSTHKGLELKKFNESLASMLFAKKNGSGASASTANPQAIAVAMEGMTI